MNFFNILVFSLLQAVTEFLPVSSSSHLFLLDHFTSLQSSKSFEVALHLGTALAILVYFYKDILKILYGLPIFIKTPLADLGSNKIIMAIIASAIMPILMGVLITVLGLDDVLRLLPIIAVNLIVFGILLYIADAYSAQVVNFKDISFKEGFFIGCAQALALIPGVSRSGACITMARILKITKFSAIKFSMLISVPIILGAALLQFMSNKSNTFAGSDFVLGFLLAFIFGLAVIKFFLFFITKFSFKIFMIYRIILGSILLIIYYI